MLTLRPIVWYFFKVCAIYVLALIPQLHGADVYAAIFRACGNVVYHDMGGSGRVKLSPSQSDKPDYDTKVTLINASVRGARGSMETDTRQMGYLPTAFTIALILATPVSWQRRIILTWIGIVLISCFVGFKFYLQLLNGLTQNDPLNVYHLGDTVRMVVVVSIKILSMTPVTSYMVPVFVWILLFFRRADLARFATMCRASNLPSQQVRST